MLIAVAAVFGFFMAWGIGANDVANAMGTSVGTKALTVKQAIIVAMIFEFAGAYLAGGEVTATIRDGIVDASAFAGQPQALVYGMMAALLSAGTWLLLASYFGWPVSTTHTIIGAIVGFSLISVGPGALQWGYFGGIVCSWIVTPMIAAILSYLLFLSVQSLFLIQRSLTTSQTNGALLCISNGIYYLYGHAEKRPQACRVELNNQNVWHCHR